MAGQIRLALPARSRGLHARLCRFPARPSSSDRRARGGVDALCLGAPEGVCSVLLAGQLVGGVVAEAAAAVRVIRASEVAPASSPTATPDNAAWRRRRIWVS
jgi:hypothetical protein